mgnify:CR=1 FL=1
MPVVTFTTDHALQKSALRQANDRLVLNLIRQNSGVSRADIVRLTGLAASSITFIVRRLKKEKLISEEKIDKRPGLGRQPTALRLLASARTVIGMAFDPDGAHILMADLEGAPLSRKTIPMQANQELFFRKVNAALCGLVQALAPGQLLGVGVALPGTIDSATGKVIGAENLGWFGVEVGALIRCGVPVPFRFENVARLSALAEQWFAPAETPGLRDFVSVVARGGIGTGVIAGGQLLRGATSAGGEFGHISLYLDGRRCACGNIGCWEQYASDLALSRAYAEQAAGEELSVDAIIARARAKEPAALKAVDAIARHVGLGFVNLVMALNPQAIVVGDYLADVWDLIGETVWTVLRSRAPGYTLSALRIYPSRHKGEAPLMGAIALVLGRFFSSFEQGGEAGPVSSVLMENHA